MEVHHHSSPAPGGTRKKWIHYFWEFLMLFLAVFCGFLAENQREHLIENNREKKYIASLLEDLKKDTADFNGDIPFWKNVLARIDTLRLEIEKQPSQRNILSIYRSAAGIRLYNNFEYHDRTIEQLKNSGNFRLIRNASISDSLIDYDALIKSELRDQEIQSNRIYQELNFQQNKIFSSRYFHLQKQSMESHLDSAFKISPEDFIFPPRSDKDLFQYYNHLEFYRTMNRFRLGATNTLLQKAINLINLLKKEYHLK